ncbi:MAG: molecular chaperone DnaJ [Candidatus Omnitrophota bacterium]
MSTARDYYEILGIVKSSSAEDIKKSYRKLVMQYHPDRVPPEKKKEAEEKFKEISEAYAVLSDSKKRSLYDQYGHAGIDSRFSTEDIFRGADFSSIFKDFGGSGSGGSVFEDLFSDLGFNIFGGGGRASRKRGEDVHYETAITLEEAASGVEKSVSFPRYENCTACGGSGAQAGSSKTVCPTCKGKGQVVGGLGFISFAQTCPVCQGEGRVIAVKCSKCGGRKRVKVNKNVKVNMPAGVDTGSVLRLLNEGNYGQGAYGNLYLHIKVKEHNLFERIESDLKCKVTISMVKAVLGADLEVPTLNGRVKMKIPPGTQSHTVFRLRGKGIVDLRTKKTGDELVEVIVEIPRRLSVKERKTFLDFAKLQGEA